MRTQGYSNGVGMAPQFLCNQHLRFARVTALHLILCVSATLLLSLGFSLAHATNLYEVEVPADGRGPDSEFAALSAAMTEALTRLTGDASVAQSKKLQSIVSDPQKYITQYGFRSAPGGGLTLKAQFDLNALDAAIKQAGLKVNRQTLPSLVVWIAEAASPSAGWQLIGSEDAGGKAAALKSEAAKRRLPLIFPLLDLEDETHVAVDDVVSGRLEKLNTASTRYATRAMLTGTLLAGGDERPGAAHLHLVLADGQSVPWSMEGNDVAVLLREATAWAADYLGKNKVPTRPEQDTVSIVIDNVSTLEDYMRALRYLRGREQAAAVNIKLLDASRATFAVKPLNDAARLTESLSEGGVLENPGIDSMSYRLLP